MIAHPPVPDTDTLPTAPRGWVRALSLLFVLFLLLLTWSPEATAVEPVAKVGFNQHIRPILSDLCFHCHGPDEKTRDADLRLDLRAGAVDSGAIVPGKPEESELLRRVISHDRSEMMPPPKAKKLPLAEAQVETLRRWIAQGAEYEEHWAFLPVQTQPLPTVQQADWPRNGVDHFILARLEREGVPPSAEADRATLIRRVSLDLTGLLPTPEEVQAFLHDPDPRAYEHLVDRLLASPHYGERWGRHWLDQARYADSNGYTIDGERSLWPYRDWVIRALNEDMPFDQFTIEQLAGDLLPHPTKNQRIATGFHRNTLINEEGGVDAEQFRVEAVMDRANTTGAVWLGLTLGCAQCHSHKFDPITHEEYFRMYAFFNQGVDVNNKGATLEVQRGEVFGKAASELAVKEGSGAKGRGKNKDTALGAKPKMPVVTVSAEHTETRALLSHVPWSPAQYVEYGTKSNAGFKLLPDNSLLADGGGSFNDTYIIRARSVSSQVAAVRLRVLTHDTLPKQGPGLAGNGNFVLTDFTITHHGVEIPISRAVADHEQPGYPAQAAIDQESRTGWAINVGAGSAVGARMNADHEIVFLLQQPITPGDQGVELRLSHDLNEKYLIGRLAVDFVERIPTRLEKSIELAQQQKAANESAKSNPAPAKLKPGPTSDVAETMVMQDLAVPRPTYLMERGDFLRPDKKLGPLQPGVIAAVQAAYPAARRQGTFRNRLDLARWLVDPANPLTARVTMNRTWMRYFGRGIVETEEDFGSQGSAPVHPELLDWLAGEFIRQGWSQKAMHRLMVTSATYRQSSQARPDLMEKDPRNLWLARQERVRVEAEIIRDAALCASGLLTPAIGGPSVRPPQPEGVYSFTQNKKNWTASTGPDRYRRGMYTLYYRSAPHPLFTTFDTPDFQLVCTRRTRSNTPLQALTMANDEAFVEMAQALAARVCQEVPERPSAALMTERVQHLFLVALGRPPQAGELALLRDYYESQAASFAQDEAGAQALWGARPLPEGLPVTQAAALTSTARVVLNTDAFVTRE